MVSVPIVCTLVAVVAFLVYETGVLERPEFVHHKTLLPNNKNGSEILAVVATTRNRDIGNQVCPLIEGSKRAVEVVLGDDRFKELAHAAATHYGVEETQLIGVGLYFDDPWTYEAPRWAIGWALHGMTQSELEGLVPQFQEASQLEPQDNPIRVVRIGGSAVETFKTRIPWRNMFTPMFAALLHWGRAFRVYDDYIVKHPEADYGIKPIALEVYVADEDDNHEFIEYNVLFGDVSTIWEDTFPGSLEENKMEEETAQKLAEKLREEQELLMDREIA